MNAPLPLLAALAATTLTASATTGTQETAPRERTRNVAIVLYEGVELLDFAGPGEVFEAAANGSSRRSPAFRVYTVAPKEGPLGSQNFLKLLPEFTIADAPQPDILVIPGGRSRVLREDEAFMAWVRRVVGETEITLSVCTGAFVLGDAGFLDGRRATTHHGAIDGLRARYAKTEVVEDVRFVDQGTIVTTAGVSAGIDGSLHVVGRLLGRDAAVETARYMQYDWRPSPEELASYPAGPPAEEIVEDVEELEADAAEPAAATLAAARDAMAERRWSEAVDLWHSVYHEAPEHRAEATYHMGRALHLCGRLDEALAVHVRAADDAVYRDRALYNAACVHALQGRPDAALEWLTRAVEAGFTQADWALEDSDLESLRERADFLALIERMRAEESGES